MLSMRRLRRRSMVVAMIGWLAIVAAPLPTMALAHIPGSWAHVPAPPGDVSITAVAAGINGRLYVFGECEGSCPQINGNVGFGHTVTYAWDPVGLHWRLGRGAPAICDTAQAAVTGADGRIRLAGCWSDMVTNPGFRVAVYDPPTRTWTLKSTFGPYVNPIVGLRDRNGRIIWYSETLTNDGEAVFASGYRLVQNIAGTWFRYRREPSTGPSDGAGLGSDGRVYVAGGDRRCFPGFEECTPPPLAAWSPTTNTWSRPTSMPTARVFVTVTGDPSGRIWTIGGMDPVTFDVSGLSEIYQPSTASWKSARPLPIPRFQAVATATADGRIWVFGGYDESGEPLSDGYVFSPH